MAEIEEKTEEVTEQPLKGRAAWQDRYRKANPEAREEVDDEDLFEYANGGYSDVENKYNQLNRANSRLAELVAGDPRLGAALSMVTGEGKKSLPYAMGSVFGKDWMDDNLEDFEAGYQENLKQLAESKKLQEEAARNTEKSIQDIEKYISDNQLGEEDAAQLNENIVAFAENLLMGIVPPALIDLVHKGLNYEQDVQDAIDTGAVQAKNERIEPQLKKLTETDVVDMGGKTASGAKDKNKPIFQPQPGSVYDNLKDIEE
ncbi:MAG: hypothetical protein LBL79_02620 [Prevotella sp.]|jgi:hypothetical protein|nr:hypothetical protein [Prevotella sp.]